MKTIKNAKQSKQRIHRNYMRTVMHDTFKAIGATYHGFGTANNIAYWFMFDRLNDSQIEAIKNSHPNPELLRFAKSRKQHAPEITSVVFFMHYNDAIN